MYEFDVTETAARRLETIAARTPDHPAAKGQDATFTYRELNAYANGVARLLSRTAPGERVVLYLSHGARIVAAIAGVLKAGGVCVPVDPTYPASRNRLILTDADASIILTDDANLAGAQAIAGETQTVINLDGDGVSPCDANVGCSVSSDSPAYLIYTSGSTGKPKGVVHTHQTLLHNAYRRGLVQKIAPQDRMTLLYSSSVMGAVSGIFTALAHGASLFINNLRHESIRGIADWIRDEKITVYHSVATLFRELASSFEPGETFPNVRLVIFGGERVSRADLDSVWKWFPKHCTVFAGFGSSETGTVRGWLLDRTTEFEGDIVPSGYPVPEMDVRVVAETGQLAAQGQSGEITVTSPFIFSGYWRDPKSTEAVLSQHPEDIHRRTYRTGDCGVLLPDERLVLSGRKDAQLSIRGFRVETGEIEAAILNHPKVKNAAVVVQDSPISEPVLAAFIALEPGADVPLVELRKHVQEHLPAHMTPSRYAILDELPTTPNGKVDRKRLTSVETFLVADADGYAPPRDELEVSLADIFGSVLGQSRFGIRTDFFEAGLSSLMAVRLLVEIERRFDCRLPLATLFEAPNIGLLGARLRENVTSDKNPSVIVINPNGSRPPLIALPGVGGVASFTYRTLAKYVGQDQPFYALQLQGLDGDGPGHRTVQAMAAHHIRVVLELQPEGPYYLVGYSFGGRLAFEMACQLRSAGREIALLALLDSSAPGYPKVAPLRVRLYLHLQRLLGMQAKERIGYLNERVKRLRKRLERFVRPAPLAEVEKTQTFDERINNVLQVTRQASKQFKPQMYHGDMVLFRATERPDWLGASFDDPKNGWGRYTAGTVSVRKLPGGHLDILEGPGVELLGREFRACLDEVMAVHHRTEIDFGATKANAANERAL